MASNVTPTEEPDNLMTFEPEIQALIDKGEIGTERSTVKIGAKVSPTGTELSAPIIDLLFKTMNAALTYHKGLMDEVLGAVSDKVNMVRRSKLRARLDAENRPAADPLLKAAREMWGRILEIRGEAQKQGTAPVYKGVIPKDFRAATSVEDVLETFKSQAEED